MKLIQNTYINYFKKFINYGIENKKELSKYYFLSVIVALLELGGVALIYPFIFRLVNTSSMPGLKDFSLGFLIIIIFLLKNLFMIYYSKLQIDFVQKSEVYISQKFMKFFLFGSYPELYNISQAQKRQILSYIIPNCINNFLLRILNLSINFFIFALITLFLFTKFFIASVVTLICALLILYIEVKFINSKIKILPLKLKESDLKIGQFLNNIMLNVKNIKISGVEQVFFTDFSNLQEEKFEYNKKFQLYNLISPYITEPLIIILLFILLAVISLQNLDKSATLIASYALIASAIFRLAPTINRLQNNLVGIKNCLPIVTDFFKFYEKFNIDNIRTVSVDDNYKELQDSIELKDISYAYDKGEVLYNINLNIRKGEFIGIAGLSGVGKTTLVDIIAGLLPPKDGKFIIDGCSYKKIPNLRIGYIPQEYGIIPVSIRENVAFGQEKIDDDRVIEVLKIARIYDYIIENYTDGIYANPFVDSTGLSQGQKQRLAIARALYTNPDILILDEATSSLDLKTEDEICESLKALKGEKTILVIAHRLSTIKFADKIVFIENGTISDIAPFDDLIVKNKNFEEFVKLSFLKNK